MTRLFIISGVPAAGKSTVSRLIAERLPASMVVEGDVIRAMPVTGRVDMSRDYDAEALRQLRLRYQAALAVAAVYLRGGFDAVVNDNILGDALNDFLAMLPCPEAHLVFLNPDPETLRQRDRDRDKTAYGHLWWEFGQLHLVLLDQTPHLGLWLDTTGQGPDQTVDDIFDRLGDSIVTGASPRPAGSATTTGGNRTT
ncbi:AAA family ATPase [Catenulispora pinisilvae]|uniref:AAA family ATPase n=1 Tax=Catenulispora pinisilvae TaxID=2705253 RepID=UPI00189183E8|nr:AAA family ATPase [Catenulispora pinisilvae]